MKAEWDDAPEWINNRRKKSAAAVLLPGLLGTCITLGALYFASQALLKGTVQQIIEKRQLPKPVPAAAITRAEPAANKDWDSVVNEAASRHIEPEPPRATEHPTPNVKQTVFNDLNYTPQGAVNIIQATSTYPIEKPAPKTNRPKEIVVVGKESRLRELCPHREGSIERRNCRMRMDLNGGR